ncbi:MAG: 4a-hydroxytetrahydrobiopterin dehydratase [Acidimicrobiia bacterium]
MALLSDPEIAEFLDSHPEWSRAGNEISRTFEFPDFVESIGFVAEVAVFAEKANHHPDIDIRWNKVTLRLSTHSEGGLTTKDLQLADRFDALYAP